MEEAQGEGVVRAERVWCQGEEGMVKLTHPDSREGAEVGLEWGLKCVGVSWGGSVVGGWPLRKPGVGRGEGCRARARALRGPQGRGWEVLGSGAGGGRWSVVEAGRASASLEDCRQGSRILDRTPSPCGVQGPTPSARPRPRTWVWVRSSPGICTGSRERYVPAEGYQLRMGIVANARHIPVSRPRVTSAGWLH